MNQMINFFATFAESIQDASEWMKTLLLAGFTSFMQYYAPINHFFYVIMVLATIDIVAGIGADRGKWEKKKFFYAFFILILYLLIILLSYWVGETMKQSQDSVISFSSWITWLMIYYYVRNSLRNMHAMFPHSEVIAFLHWALTMKFINKITFLEEFQKSKQKEKE